jgi:hypothetical protein
MGIRDYIVSDEQRTVFSEWDPHTQLVTYTPLSGSPVEIRARVEPQDVADSYLADNELYRRDRDRQLVITFPVDATFGIPSVEVRGKFTIPDPSTGLSAETWSITHILGRNQVQATAVCTRDLVRERHVNNVYTRGPL